jgi:hypothetical protein
MQRLLFTFVLALILATPVTAQPSIQVTLTSFHFDRKTDFNELNFGIGLGYDLGPATVSIGVYNNSHNRATWYLAAERTWPEGNWVAVGGFVGVATGYKHPVIPVAAPALTWGTPKVRLRTAYIPVDQGVIAPQLSYHWTE